MNDNPNLNDPLSELPKQWQLFARLVVLSPHPIYVGYQWLIRERSPDWYTLLETLHRSRVIVLKDTIIRLYYFTLHKTL